MSRKSRRTGEDSSSSDSLSSPQRAIRSTGDQGMFDQIKLERGFDNLAISGNSSDEDDLANFGNSSDEEKEERFACARGKVSLGPGNVHAKACAEIRFRKKREKI